MASDVLVSLFLPEIDVVLQTVLLKLLQFNKPLDFNFCLLVVVVGRCRVSVSLGDSVRLCADIVVVISETATAAVRHISLVMVVVL